MKLFNILAVAFACAMTVPVCAAENQHKAFYVAPKPMEMHMSMVNKTDKSVTLRFEIKPAIGACSDIMMSVNAAGNSTLVAVPSTKEIKSLKKGETGSFDFVLPITEEQSKDPSLKIQGRVKYVPDYDEMLKYVEANQATTYQDENQRERLIRKLQESKVKKSSYTDLVRYAPNKD